MTLVNKPRQGAVRQSCVSLSGPLQSDPLLRGGGLMQACVRTCVPRPHVTEQSDQTDHGVQSPSTGNDTQDLAVWHFQGNPVTCPMAMCIFSKHSYQLNVSLCSSTRLHQFYSFSWKQMQLPTSAIDILAVISLRGACTGKQNKSLFQTQSVFFKFSIVEYFINMLLSSVSGCIRLTIAYTRPAARSRPHWAPGCHGDKEADRVLDRRVYAGLLQTGNLFLQSLGSETWYPTVPQNRTLYLWFNMLYIYQYKERHFPDRWLIISE